MATWTATLWLEDIAKEENHRTIGLARMLWQYRGTQPRLQGALGAFLDMVQDLEDVSYDVLVERWPLTAIGVQLNLVGAAIGQSRGGLTDDEYRVYILGRIYVNRADGQSPQFYELFDILGILDDAAIHDEPPRAFSTWTFEANYPFIEFDLAHDMKPGGVTLTYIYSTYIADETFRADSAYGGADVSATNGAGSVYDATVGGHSAGCFR